MSAYLTGRAGKTLGVLGGMGPLASAEFVRTVYRLHSGPDQSHPRLLLDSDPAFPDRTEAIRTGRTAELVDRMDTRLRELLARGADRLVIACYTAHHVLDEIDPVVRASIVSLVDTALAALATTSGRFLLLCTEGTRQARVFQRAPGWAAVSDRVVEPDAADQHRLHQLIYRMKHYGPLPLEAVAEVDRLLARYGCVGTVLGCTEFHLVSEEFTARYGVSATVDALRHIAVGAFWARTAGFAPLLASGAAA